MSGQSFGIDDMQSGVWRNGSASDSRSEGWEFESLCPHLCLAGVSRLQKPSGCAPPWRASECLFMHLAREIEGTKERKKDRKERELPYMVEGLKVASSTCWDSEAWASRCKYIWPGSNWRPSACEADVIATRPQMQLHKRQLGFFVRPIILRFVMAFAGEVFPHS